MPSHPQQFDLMQKYCLFSLVFRLGRASVLSLILISSLSAQSLSLDTWLPSGEFSSESAPGNNDQVRVVGDGVEYISSGNWVSFSSLNFGTGASYFEIEASSQNALPTSATLEVRLGATNGPLIGTVNITTTGSWGNYVAFGSTLDPAPTGIQNVYFIFNGPGGYLYNIKDFIFRSVGPGLKKTGSQLGTWLFDQESAPGAAPIVAQADHVDTIQGGSWIAFEDYDFGNEANSITLEASTANKGGLVEVRLDSPTGPKLGTVQVTYTSGWDQYYKHSILFNQTVSGQRDLYFCFVDSMASGGSLLNTREFWVSRLTPEEFLPVQENTDGDQSTNLQEYAMGMHPEVQDRVPFQIVADENGNSRLQLRARASDRLSYKVSVTTDLESWEEATLSYADGAWNTDSSLVSIQDVRTLSGGISEISLGNDSSERLFFQKTVELVPGSLNVYDPVPGLTPSPYYSYSVQRLDQINAANFQDVTNWESPFAFFTECIDHVPEGPERPADYQTAYFSQYIGGWSHTYCNFELEANTPIVVKITRIQNVTDMDEDGIPGPLDIQSATPYPPDLVESCQIINGDVYVVMDQPGLVSIDIDGQMGGRDTPRNYPISSAGFGGSIDRTKEKGVHAVSIFANPFIEDKPVLGDPGVYAVEPGTLPPADGPWTTLYFKPGIHKLSVDTQGNEREWYPEDIITALNGRNYYIPGDAIVYGNIQATSSPENIRIFGHGTLSGHKMVHFQDFSDTFKALHYDYSDPEHPNGKFNNAKLRMLQLGYGARGCTFEGITVANPAEHGIYMYGAGGAASVNYSKWMKLISWRVNNDGMVVSGNTYAEDCFLRHQDDALYVEGLGTRRMILWSDVNGAPMRLSFALWDEKSDLRGSGDRLVVEDIDLIFVRAMFANDAGIIAAASGRPPELGRAVNEGEYLHFKNITVWDPRPQRVLFGLKPPNDPTKLLDHKGIIFENINYMHAPTWEHLRATLERPELGVSKIIGEGNALFEYLVFDNVWIDGDQVDQAHLDSADFNSDMANPIIY